MDMNLSLGSAAQISVIRVVQSTRDMVSGLIQTGQNAFLALGGRCPCSQSNVSTPCAARRVDNFTEGLVGAIKAYYLSVALKSVSLAPADTLT